MRLSISTILLGVLLLVSSCTVQNKAPKIIISYNCGINYVTHLYTLAGIGFEDQDYCNKYGNTVSQEDLNFLRKHYNEMSFANGSTGEFTSFLFFVPAYVNLQSTNDYQTYFDDIDRAFQNKDYTIIDKYIPKNQKESNKYLFSLPDDQWEIIMQQQMSLDSIAEVYIRNFDSFATNVWPNIQPELEKKAQYFNSQIKGNELIPSWERVTGLNWIYGDYTFLLYGAGKNGPSFNNLSENINSLYYNNDEIFIISMFSHEFGIFLMYDSIIESYIAMQDKYPQYEDDVTTGNVCWMAFESLSVFFNCMIHNEKTTDYYNFEESDAKTFYEIYDTLYKNGITNVTELYLQGIEKYMASR